MTNPPKRIYAVPFEFTVQCTLFVVAESPESAALRSGEHMLADEFGFDDDSVWLEGAERAKVLDIVNERFIEGAVPQPVPTDDYDPTDHPDWED